MNLSQQFGDVDAIDASQNNPLQKLYPKLVQEYYETNTVKTGPQYFSSLWASMSPCGNIYRHLALQAECRKHSYNLQYQIMELAEDHKTILGGSSVSLVERSEILTEFLKQASVTCYNKDLDKSPATGFPPLEEFLACKVRRIGWLYVPRDWEGFKAWFRTCVLAWCMLVVQTVAPATVFINRWGMDTNLLKDPDKMYHSLDLEEVTCLGPDFNGKATTLIGTLLLFLVIFMVRSYAVNEREEARKSGVLPVHGFWISMGVVANSLACVLLCLALPFLFWSEDNVTSLLLDSCSLTFLFSLDDLSGGLCGDIDDDPKFQRSCAWQAILLSQCPVRVADLVNPHARRAKDLWQITIDSGGSLVIAEGAKPGATRGQVCETRFHYKSFDGEVAEEAPLLDNRRKLFYRTSPTSTPLELPTLRTEFVMAWWVLLTMFLFIYQILVAPMFFIFNAPCSPLEQAVENPEAVATTAAAVVTAATAAPTAAAVVTAAPTVATTTLAAAATAAPAAAGETFRRVVSAARAAKLATHNMPIAAALGVSR